MEEKNELKRWIKEHKAQLIAAGIGVAALIVAIVTIKNWDEIVEKWEYLKDLLHPQWKGFSEETIQVLEEVVIPPNEEPACTLALDMEAEKESFVQEAYPDEDLPVFPDSKPVFVSEHIRNLPDGWHPSPEKIAEAEEKNIPLTDGQTWVDSYTKGGAA